MGLYRRFYRQENMSFAGAGLRGIGSSSISFNHTEQGAELQPLPRTVIQHARIASGPSRDAMPNPSCSLFNGRHDPAREIALNGQVPLHQKRVHRPVRQKGIAVA